MKTSSHCTFVTMNDSESFHFKLISSSLYLHPGIDSGSVIDRTDDQRGGVFTTIIKRGTEEWVEFLSEGAASKGVDKSCSIYVIKGDQTLLIIHKHPHLLKLTLQREID